MSILENNFNRAYQTVSDLVEKEKENTIVQEAPYIIVQVAHNEESFELLSATLTPSNHSVIANEIANDTYYNMVFIAEGIHEVLTKFKDKYLFKLAYADICFALYTAYRSALMSENGEFTLHTSFYKSSLEDWAWAYEEVFHYSDFGHFRCWFNYDEQYKNVDIQADNDLIAQFDKLELAEKNRR